MSLSFRAGTWCGCCPPPVTAPSKGQTWDANLEQWLCQGRKTFKSQGCAGGSQSRTSCHHGCFSVPLFDTNKNIFFKKRHFNPCASQGGAGWRLASSSYENSPGELAGAFAIFIIKIHSEKPKVTGEQSQKCTMSWVHKVTGEQGHS